MIAECGVVCSASFSIDVDVVVVVLIGQADFGTRVLLRRLPWKIIVDGKYMDSPQLSHLLKLAEEKKVPVEEYPLRHYKCCGIIKNLSDA